MGLFLCLSGVIGSDKAGVEAALAAYARSNGGECLPQQGPTEDEDILGLSENAAGSLIFYPDNFLKWDDASAFLSRQLRAPVFAFHIHDDDLWMFTLYVDGIPVTNFNPIPDYWDDDIPEDEIEKWRGDARVVCRYVPGLEESRIEKYFTRWDLDDDRGRAYPDDQFPNGDCWQLCDFIKKTGLHYPSEETREGSVTAYRFHVSRNKQG